MKDKKISIVLLFISALFLALIVYLTGIEVFNRDEYSSSNLNSRALIKESSVIRGTIYDREGEILARSKMEGDTQSRHYPHKALYSHIIGYSSKTYGKSFLEKSYNSRLLGDDGISAVFNIGNIIKGEMSEGNSLHLTIDHPTQQRASYLMSRYRGAAVAINPKTGEVLAMVSKPDFNPNETYLTRNWSKLNSDENAPFLNRATMGLYPPGSTFKTVIAATAYDKGLTDFVVEDDEGKFTIDGYTIANTKNARYGTTDMEKGFIRSSNVYFAHLGTTFKQSDFDRISSSFMFNKKIPFKFPMATSKFQTDKMSTAEMAATSIGQGKTLVSPLHLAMITGAIANKGVMMKPYIVSKITSPGGTVLESFGPSDLGSALSEGSADYVKDLMVTTVEKGTGTNARIWGMDIGGKTGTAENELTDTHKEKTHALFIAFAPAEDPQIAVAVVLEHAGSTGGSIAAPIAREMIRTYLDN